MWSCSSCGKVFKNYMLMKLHHRTHSEFRPFVCSFKCCTKAFHSLSELQSHARYHKEHRIYRCKTCCQQFFTLRHQKLHRCQGNNLRFHWCHICAAGFTQIVSLANHIHKNHLLLFKGKHMISTKWKLPFGDDKHSHKSSYSESGSDDSKILLKITAGKSMTIVSPLKLSSHKSRNRHWKKKSKKKDKKENMKAKCNGLILSIKRDMISINDEKQNFNNSSLQKCNGLLTSNCMLAEQKSDLKLTIKTCPEISHTPRKIDSKAYSYVSDSDAIPISNKRICNDEDQDAMEAEDVSNKLVTTLKERNGIVISKDKLGKFLSEQLPIPKASKRDRENMFDSFKDVEIWKVMPSLATDRPEDLLKIKLSPHKPVVKTDQMFNEANAFDRLKYLEIPSKVKDGISGEDSDVLDLLQADEKESEVGINSVNDSGIEVLSSSSYNRSNENSVRSAVYDENSPTYLNAEDSLLSLDSPFMEGLCKTEHSICNRCGAIILEQNNNTHSPGKCRCGLSGPNSPFHPPVSPSKTFSHLSDTSKTQEITTIESHVIVDDTKHIANTSLNPSVGSKTVVVSENEYSSPFDVSQIGQCDSDDSDILLISIENNKTSLKETAHKDSERNKRNCRLKLKKKDSKISAERALNKECNSCNSREHVQTCNVNIVMSPHLNIDKDLYEQTSSTSSNVCKVNVGMNSCISPNIVIDDEDNGENTKNKYMSYSEPVTRKRDTSQLSQKRPMFKNKKPESNSVASENNAKNVNQEFTEYGFVNKKPLSIKRPSFDDTPCGSKPPLSKRHKSAPGDCASDLINTESRSEDPSIISLVSENLEHAKSTENGLLSCLQNKVSEYGKQIDTSNSISDDLVNKVNDTKQMKDSCADTFENCEKIGNTNADGNTVFCNDNDDSLKQQPEITNNGTNTVTKITESVSNHLNLFQNQFLSFICDNDQSKGKKLARSKNKLVRKGSQLHGNTNNNVVDLIKCKQSENVEVTKLTSPARKDKTSDSCSQLRIFSEKTKSDKSKIGKKTEKPKDEMMDIDHEAINMKMVNSEGEDTHSFDIDDSFKLEKCPSVEPNLNISAEGHGRIQKVQSKINLLNESSAVAQPRRRQVAKRTGMKVQSKKTINHENDYKYSDSASSADTIDLVSHYDEAHDPHFNPFNDSDEDFVTVAHHTKNLSHACSEVKRKSSEIEISSSSDDEVRSDSDIDEKCDPQSTAYSRKNRTKKGRRSSCPCCMGLQKLNTKEHIVEHHPKQNYRLPRNHKQFIKNTLRLLALQEKLHILFLNLFPECFDRLTKSKVGTDEFEVLIEDILDGLEDNSTELPTVFPSTNFTVQDPLTNTDFSSCPVDISISVPDVTRTNGIDFVCLDDKSLTSANKETSLMNTSVMYRSESSFNDFDLCNVPTSIFNQTRTCFTEHSNSQNSGSHKSELILSSANSGLVCLSESLTNLKFENNTLAGSPDGKFHKLLSANKCTLDQHAFDIAGASSNEDIIPSVVTHGNSATFGLDILLSAKNDDDINLASSICLSSSSVPTSVISSAPYCENTNCEQTVDSMQSELVITIDLSAARVSLCQNPKKCLNWLQNKIMRLTQCLFPRIILKKYIYKNIDNLEFMLDLLIEANSSGDHVPSEEEDLGFSFDVWNVPSYGIIQTLLVPTGINVEDMNLNAVLPEIENNLDRETLFVNCFALNALEQEIKLQQASLKKDLFQVDDKPELMFNNTDDILSNSEHVLHSIQSLSKIASRNRKTKSRDSRHRERSADDKRTMFALEKLNSQNSIILHNPNKSNKTKWKLSRKGSSSEDSKTTFLSQFNLGDKCETSISSQVISESTSLDSLNNHSSLKNPKNVTRIVGKHSMEKISVRSKTKAHADSADACIDKDIEHSKTFAEDIDTEMENHLRLGKKNIFELVQPC